MINLNQCTPDLWEEIFENDDIKHCFNCGTCVTVCPASNADPPLLIRKLVRMVLFGLEDELLDEDTPWACVTCSKCEEMCPMGVRPFEVGLAIRRWQVKNDETRIPPSTTSIFSEGYTQAVAKVKDLRKSIGLEELPTIDKYPELQKRFRGILCETQLVKENDYMFKE